MKTLIAPAIVVSIFSILVSSCGPASPTVEIRLKTGLEKTKNFKNLMKGLSTPPSALVLPANRCIQKNLYAGFSAGDRSDDHLETTRVPIVLDYSAGVYDINDTFLQTAELPEISLKIPRGVPVGVGILGSLSSAQRLDPDGVSCAEFDNTVSPIVPYVTSSLIGHTRIIASGPMDVPLKIWVTPSNVAPQATPAGGCNNYDQNQSCPFLDYLQLTCGNCAADGRSLRVEYAFDRNSPEKRVIQMIPSSRADLAYIPNIFPVRVSFLDSNLAPISSRIFVSSEFSGSGNRTVSQNFTPAQTGSATQTITLTEWSSSIIPTISPPTLLALTGLGYGPAAITLNWSPGTNIDQYTVKYSTTSGGPYSYVQAVPGNSTNYNLTALAPPSAYYLVVEGSNFQGSTPVISNEQMYVPLGPMSAPSVTPSTGSASVTWGTGPSGAGIVPASYTTEAYDSSTDALVTTCPGAVYPATGTTCSLSPGSYYFKVKADNSSYGGYTVSPVSATVAVP